MGVVVTYITDILDVDNLDRHVIAGTVRRVGHPTEPLMLFNYTQTCQFSGAWDNESRASRGLIVRRDGLVIARPFPKFHNLYEHGDESAAGPIRLVPPLTVFDKLDGSLGIAYKRPSDGRIAWATRGSFTSDQAIWATEWWGQQRRSHVVDVDDVTLLAEIIYPANRIVVDYGGQSGLTLLAAIDNATGDQVGPFDNEFDWWPGAQVECFGVTDDVSTVNANDRPNAEGYVILSGDRRTRVKIKGDEYMRLHKILTGISSVSVWDMLRNGDDLSVVRDGVPDEFGAWLESTIDGLNAKHAAIASDARQQFARMAMMTGDRKAFAAEAVKSTHRGLLFALLDGKPIDAAIWQAIRPERETPFIDQEPVT